MADIDIAKDILDRENNSIAIVKNGNLIFSSKERGIKPIYMALKEQGAALKGSSVADKVVGKAAAMIYIYGGVKEFYTKLISENAIKILDGTSILYEYDESVPYIKNFDGSRMCPIETISVRVNDVEELLKEISEFLKI